MLNLIENIGHNIVYATCCSFILHPEEFILLCPVVKIVLDNFLNCSVPFHICSFKLLYIYYHIGNLSKSSSNGMVLMSSLRNNTFHSGLTNKRWNFSTEKSVSLE